MISQEEIDKVFENDEKYHRRCNIILIFLESIFKKKIFYCLIVIFLLWAVLYIILAPSITQLLIRTAAVIGIILGIILFVFAASFINGIAATFAFKKKSIAPISWLFQETKAVHLRKKLHSEDISAEQKLIDLKNKLHGKGKSIYSILYLFSFYQQKDDNEKCISLLDEARKLYGLCDYSDRIIVLMEYSYALYSENNAEAIRLFESNQQIISDNALESPEELVSYLNNLAEYHYAKGEYYTALEIFFKKRECHSRCTLQNPAYSTRSEIAVLDELDIAKCCLKLDMLEEARQHYSTASEFADDDYSKAKCSQFNEKLTKKVGL